VFQFGTFDVRNYGDLLFPLLARRRLNEHGFDVIPVAPTNRRTGWADTLDPLDVAQIMQPDSLPVGLLIGGGNIIHARRVTLPDYQKDTLAEWAYASLWIGASAVAAVHDVPVVWNAPGVPYSFLGTEVDAIVPTTLAAADYVAVRDRGSAKFLAATGSSRDSFVVPDSAAEIASLWSRAELAADFKMMLERRGAAVGRYVAIHLKERSLDEPVDQLARRLDAFASATGLVPILVALAACHDDHLAGRRLAAHLQCPAVLLDEPLGLREIAATIAWSDLYVGASLHGYITAFAYGTPAVLIARPNLPKHDGFLEHVERAADLVLNWEAGLATALIRSSAPRQSGLPRRLAERLDAHWLAIAKAMNAPAGNRLARAALLRTLIKGALAESGWSWVLKPFIGRNGADRAAIRVDGRRCQ
jgi:polysaccharide pyruvyl transferase WcaK-like protein